MESHGVAVSSTRIGSHMLFYLIPGDSSNFALAAAPSELPLSPPNFYGRYIFIELRPPSVNAMLLVPVLIYCIIQPARN